MASDAQIMANRRNSRLSTGPTDTSRTRLNAAKHGIFSREVVLSNGTGAESIDLFEAISNRFFDELRPEGVLEEAYTEELVTIVWRRWRVWRFETAAAGAGRERLRGMPAFDGSEDGPPALPNDKETQRILRYDSTLARRFDRVVHELQRLQAVRLSGRIEAPPVLDISLDVGSSSN